MASGNVLSGFIPYVADCLKIFALPVTTIKNAADRSMSLVGGLITLAFLTIVAVLLRYGVALVPGGASAPITFTDLALEEISTFLFFIISYLLLFALIVVFGGKANLARLLSAKLSLVSAIIGAFVLALLAKLVIGLLYMGASDGVAGGLYRLGSQFGAIAISFLLGVYTIIVARFGGQLSWALAALVGVLHFVLMVALYQVYNIAVLGNQFDAIDLLTGN